MEKQHHTWRGLLGKIISNMHERERIANELNVRPVTLTRWVNGDSAPRRQNLHQLLKATPQHRDELLPLIQAEFPDFSPTREEELADSSPQIPAEFYTRVIYTFNRTVSDQRFWTISSLILQQMLGQLDPNQLGMAITIAQCMPPSYGQKVRSLRERTGRGTHPWSPNLDQESIFLGIESLAGYAVTEGRLLTDNDRTDQQTTVSTQWMQWEQSATACPIIHQGRIAGCIVVSSKHPNYFLPFRQALIQLYAELMVFAFTQEEFYRLEDIELRPVPHWKIQKEHFSHRSQNISTIMMEALRQQRQITVVEAEQMVWKQLEEELLGLHASSVGE